MTQKATSRSKVREESDAMARSYREWQKKYFPELEKKEKFEKLRSDSKELATTLADDIFNRVISGERED